MNERSTRSREREGEGVSGKRRNLQGKEKLRDENGTVFTQDWDLGSFDMHLTALDAMWQIGNPPTRRNRAVSMGTASVKNRKRFIASSRDMKLIFNAALKRAGIWERQSFPHRRRIRNNFKPLTHLPKWLHYDAWLTAPTFLYSLTMRTLHPPTPLFPCTTSKPLTADK